MARIKKSFSVVLAAVMLLSCFLVVANAYTYAPSLTSGEVAIKAEADKTTVSSGDIVKITLKIDRGTKGAMGAINQVIVYNGSQINPNDTQNADNFRQFVGDFQQFANPNARVNYNNLASRLARFYTEEEKAYFTNTVLIMGGSTSSANRWNPEKDEAYITFNMKVSDTVQPGEEIWLGLHDAAYRANMSNMAEGTVTLKNTEYNLTNSMVKLTVAGGEQPQASALKHEKRQVKMDWADQAAGTILAGSHQLRVISQIAEADLQKAVGATDDATIATKILKAGVVAFKGNKAAFNMETAKTLAQSEMLQQGDYSKSETTYIQHANGVYRFGARVEYKSALYDTAYVTYLAYVDETGKTQYLFLDAAEELLYATKQTDIENLWKGGQPKA